MINEEVCEDAIVKRGLPMSEENPFTHRNTPNYIPSNGMAAFSLLSTSCILIFDASETLRLGISGDSFNLPLLPTAHDPFPRFHFPIKLNLSFGFASVPFLRASSIIQSDHFYTTNISEIEGTLSDGVFAFDGNSAFLWSTPQPGTIPLFRLYNENSTDHFYTMSSDELPEMMAKGWTYDAASNHTAGYVYQDP
ncbi:hypothetical protein F5876DRAFT_77190 [Lentinula aff. lateritia]|uniref:Uncharacterized protein n=1 Tax=Lentinula aff. lateritia TaxID=2804960 RepID=A0ACC1U091_9AGAR|nr:hypothetical protein F5876DRAFT_77190 [Lentinula aff. lateritia]